MPTQNIEGAMTTPVGSTSPAYPNEQIIFAQQTIRIDELQPQNPTTLDGTELLVIQKGTKTYSLTLADLKASINALLIG